MHTLLDKKILIRFYHEICAEDQEIFFELLGDCQKDLEEQTSLLRKFANSASWKDFNRAAHTIKSTAKTFGATELQNLSKELEDESRSPNHINDSVIKPRIDLIEKMTNQVVQELAHIGSDRSWLV